MDWVRGQRLARRRTPPGEPGAVADGTGQWNPSGRRRRAECVQICHYRAPRYRGFARPALRAAQHDGANRNLRRSLRSCSRSRPRYVAVTGPEGTSRGRSAPPTCAGRRGGGRPIPPPVWQPSAVRVAAVWRVPERRHRIRRGPLHPPAPPCMALGGGFCREEFARSHHCTPPAPIGAPGFEPGTSPTRTVRATRLRHAPRRTRIEASRQLDSFALWAATTGNPTGFACWRSTAAASGG
jgi:hypothetical protein